MNALTNPGSKTLQFDLTARKSILTIAGQKAEVLTYNNSFPGPLLEAQEGDQVMVRFHNQLQVPSNLHLHGIFMSPEDDKPHEVVAPGTTLTYAFEAQAGSAGMYWYHPHAHGSVTRQLFEGLSGPMIIRGPLDRIEPLASATEKVLVLHDIQIENGKVAPHEGMDWGRGKEGNLVLVNGESRPTLPIPTGLLRLRIVNASAARYYKLGVPGKKLQVIGLDGSFLEQPVSVDTLLLSPGERADILLEATEASTLSLLNLPYKRTPMGPSQDTPVEGALLATFEVQGDTNTVHLPEKLLEIPELNLATATDHKTLTFGATMQPLQFTINNKVFDHHRTDLSARADTLEVWDIVNPMGMDHPFHLHTFPFQLISLNGEPAPFRAWKDVVNVPANSTVRIAIPFRKYTGKVMYHCHILEHEDVGMMGNLEVL
ncbi:FtsP/CotA-like multicopper oxidase with cupredoxin domain [Pontibacter ummariensis]|uniref:Multicopper oxidase with three cupredoxin domains (Includes cell division protein FtsP and spore coat protein CotA) n=1 Tax=Pontibacter ummariensis TaxID=1610492 RepID=A0A239KFB5_9BACT|nr:multicopper oxidase family protein [Pontibacter ummariensis]PRY06405.1 FtsP/CotA-like multicopper oxidase with cupredoxin domain [Pontibacter ummariensis]SNT16680.1 Multicopper oxidase with three cupredoxin domains (includes cell division protein FtsP and spore coat protein CotA) [Pontibacter ummariensis]